MTKRSGKRTKRRARRKTGVKGTGEQGEVVTTLDERVSHHEVSPTLSGGDVDADWQRAQSSGEEAVGGSVATPDQDVVDEIGHALGVEQGLDAQVHSSAEILRARTRRYWAIERRAAEGEEP